jgi:hypothetical protein
MQAMRAPAQRSQDSLNYQYALLDPRPAAPNESVFSRGPVLGIEIAVDQLARRCQLGNIDPQHLGGDPGRAAVEEAVVADLPPLGAILATVRPDPDSIGAMAVLELRAAGTLSRAATARIRLIAKTDIWRRGPWPGPLPDTLPPEGLGGALEPIGALVADDRIPLADRVRRMMEWLDTGTCEDVDRVAGELAAEHEAALARTSVGLSATGKVAVVAGPYRHGMALGYRLAPVVVAENPSFVFQGGAPHRKVTIAQYELGWVDLPATVSVLGASEPGWGGSPTICGSPQGEPCRLPTADIVAVVEEHLLPR